MSNYPKVSKENIQGSKIQWSETSISEDKCTFLFTIRNFSLLNKKKWRKYKKPNIYDGAEYENLLVFSALS